MSRCLVTGAGGFLGGYVVDEARRRGVDVVDPGSMRLPSSELAPFVRDAAPEYVVHLAAPASVAASIADPHADFVGCVDGTACLVDALRRGAPRARLVLVSSAAVYGNPPALPVREDAPEKPLSPYGYHKLLSELLVDEASRLWGAWTAVARVFSAYGPGLRRQVVYELCAKAARGEPLVLDGTGDESRDFVHAADVARAVWTLLERAPGTAERFNVATGIETRIGHLADAVARAARAEPARFSGRARPGDPARWCADVSAIAALGWSQRVKLDDGVAEVLRWVRSGATSTIGMAAR
jgi:UDP-glucose 4-epimerase